MKNWLKSSFEDSNNKTSSKRLTGFWMVLMTTLVVAAGIYDLIQYTYIPTNFLFFLIIMLTSVLLLFMVITIENIIQLVKAIRNTTSKQE